MLIDNRSCRTAKLCMEKLCTRWFPIKHKKFHNFKAKKARAHLQRKISTVWRTDFYNLFKDISIWNLFFMFSLGKAQLCHRSFTSLWALQSLSGLASLEQLSWYTPAIFIVRAISGLPKRLPFCGSHYDRGGLLQMTHLAIQPGIWLVNQASG